MPNTVGIEPISADSCTRLIAIMQHIQVPFTADIVTGAPRAITKYGHVYVHLAALQRQLAAEEKHRATAVSIASSTVSPLTPASCVATAAQGNAPVQLDSATDATAVAAKPLAQTEAKPQPPPPLWFVCVVSVAAPSEVTLNKTVNVSGLWYDTEAKADAYLAARIKELNSNDPLNYSSVCKMHMDQWQTQVRTSKCVYP